jgi:hypothetical protein
VLKCGVPDAGDETRGRDRLLGSRRGRYGPGVFVRVTDSLFKSRARGCRRRRAAVSPRRVLSRSVWLGLFVAVVWAPGAGAFVYWGDTGGYAIGRSGPGGEAATTSFLKLPLVLPCGVAVDGRYVYWADIRGAIGRARIDGTGKPDPSFIVGAMEPCGLAVYGNHLYWVNKTLNGSIGRASLTGPRDVLENFVPSEQGSGRSDLAEPCGVAVDATGIYWSNTIGGTVGHANLDGTGERTLLAGTNRVCGVALGGGYVYWANEPYVGSGTIGRALESGAGVDNTYIRGLSGPCGAAVYSHYLYFADGSTIDRADLSSSDPTASTQQIVMGTKSACGVAVDGLYQGHLTIVHRRSKRHGAVALTIRTSDPGQVTVQQASGRITLLRPAHARARRAGELTIIIHPTAAATTQLRTHRSMPVRVRISYLPAGGITSTTTTTVVLRAP